MDPAGGVDSRVGSRAPGAGDNTASGGAAIDHHGAAGTFSRARGDDPPGVARARVLGPAHGDVRTTRDARRQHAGIARGLTLVELQVAGHEDAYTPGSEADFDRLYRASYPRILRTLVGIVGSRQAAEDCAQEAFTRALGAWRTWSGGAPAEAWMHRIAINTAISHRRRERIRSLPSLLLRLGVPPPGRDPAADAEQRSVVAELRRLPPKQAAAVVLRHYHGYTNREIATALGVTERTVGYWLAAALTTLRARLEMQAGR